MQISLEKIENWAPNSDAVKNGKSLVAKFSNTHIDAQSTIIWGECAGSGKEPYRTSADFMKPEDPTFRCSCPSRQFPCKHSIGLLFTYLNGKSFTTSEIPTDLAQKRSKIESREEKKKVEKEDTSDQPKKVNTSAIVKRTEAMLAGIETAQQLLNGMTQIGLSSLDAKEKANMNAQIKELGNYYIPGIQTAFQNFMLELNAVTNDQYDYAIDQVNYLFSLLKKAKAYLEERKEDPLKPLEIGSSLEEQIGTVWKIADLASLGMSVQNASMIQLAFYNQDDQARMEIVDTGVWMNLKSGKIYQTKNYRPHKALKYVKEENSRNSVVEMKEFTVYPGVENQRIRWETEHANDRSLTQSDISTVHQYAQCDYSEVFSWMKNIVKNPLNIRRPLALIGLTKAWVVGEDLVLEDRKGTLLALTNPEDVKFETVTALQNILPAYCEGFSLLVAMHNDIKTGNLTAQPLSLITPNRIIKLLF